MGFLGYLLMGSIVYVAGFMVNMKLLRPKRKVGVIDSATHPIILS